MEVTGEGGLRENEEGIQKEKEKGGQWTETTASQIRSMRRKG